MELKIRLENADPPSGWIVLAQHDRPTEETLPEFWFSGWLGLLQAIDDALHAPCSPVARRQH